MRETQNKIAQRFQQQLSSRTGVPQFARQDLLNTKTEQHEAKNKLVVPTFEEEFPDEALLPYKDKLL